MRNSMLCKEALILAFCIFPSLQIVRSQADEIKGVVQYNTSVGASWLDLAALKDFHAGDLLRIHLENYNAKCVLVRLLSRTDDPMLRIGVIDEVQSVDANTLTIAVRLKNSFADIRQISVHGRLPWAQFICRYNGTPKIKSIEYVPNDVVERGPSDAPKFASTKPVGEENIVH